MDKIEKELRKLSPKERITIKHILDRLRAFNLQGLDIKKLRGREDIFRVRKGALRIIYRLENKNIFILTIERRNESTYKF
jgi:mRNA-degrading endonuclease RelE of RelBE toxin-antitoxin system